MPDDVVCGSPLGSAEGRYDCVLPKGHPQIDPFDHLYVRAKDGVPLETQNLDEAVAHAIECWDRPDHLRDAINRIVELVRNEKLGLTEWENRGPWRISGHAKIEKDAPAGGMTVGEPRWCNLPRGGYNESTYRAIVGILNRDALR